MSNQLGTIAILGSGETSPNLVAVHRKLLEKLPKPKNLNPKAPLEWWIRDISFIC